MFSRRQEQIIYYLLKEVHVVSTVTLCTFFSVSERTLRKDIHDINLQFKQSGMEILHIRSKGYLIPEQDRGKIKKVLIDNEKYAIDQPETQEERILYILFALLWEREYISLEKIASEIYVSKTTLYTDFQRVKSYLKENFEIVLDISKTKGFRINVSESHKREILSHIISNHGQRYKYLLKMFYKRGALIEDEYHEILCLLHQWSVDSGYTTTNMDLIHLALEIQIFIARMKNGFFVEQENTNQNVSISFPFVQIEEICDISWPEKEKKYLLEVISNKSFFIAKKAYYDFRVSDLVEVFLHKVQIQLNHEIQFIQDDVNELKEYVQMMILCLHHGVHDKKIVDINIEKEYPLFYSLAQYLGPLVKEEYNVELTQFEYEQITFLLVGMIYYSVKEKRVLLVSDYSQPVIFYLIKKLKFQFRQLNIVSILNTETYCNNMENQYDLVLATHLIKYDVPENLVYIDIYLDDMCIKRIQDYISEFY